MAEENAATDPDMSISCLRDLSEHIIEDILPEER